MQVEVGHEGLCGARARHGGVCRKQAGWGTKHLGFGACRLHGGATRSHRIRAATSEAQQYALATYGVSLTPDEALIVCVRIAAGEVAYLTQKVHALDEDEAIVRHEVVTEWDPSGARKTVTIAPDAHVLIRARQNALDRLARFSRMAIDAGIEDRMVEVAERFGALVARVLDEGARAADLTYEQREAFAAAMRETTSQAV